MNHPFSRYRALFPVTREWVYLNHAATSPYSSLTAEAMGRYIRGFEEMGGLNYKIWDQTKEEVRALAGRMLNCGPKEIALVSNTSEGANIVAQGLPFAPGDNLVVPDHEFPANFYPWINLQRKGVEVRVVPLEEGKADGEAIMARVDDKTRLVAVSSVAFHNGYCLDLDWLGCQLKEKEILFYVDAIQSLGVMPVDVQRSHISFLAADGHKWLLAPEGAGLFYCSAQAMSCLEPAYVSWLSVEEPFQFDQLSLALAETARRFECGTPNFCGIAGLHQSLTTLLEAGMDRIRDWVLQMTEYAQQGLIRKGYRVLSPWGEGERSGILTFDHPHHPADHLVKALEEKKVITTVRGGGVRISPHLYNNVEDMDRFLEALPDGNPPSGQRG